MKAILFTLAGVALACAAAGQAGATTLAVSDNFNTDGCTGSHILSYERTNWASAWNAPASSSWECVVDNYLDPSPTVLVPAVNGRSVIYYRTGHPTSTMNAVVVNGEEPGTIKSTGGVAVDINNYTDPTSGDSMVQWYDLRIVSSSFSVHKVIVDNTTSSVVSDTTLFTYAHAAGTPPFSESAGDSYELISAPTASGGINLGVHVVNQQASGPYTYYYRSAATDTIRPAGQPGIFSIAQGESGMWIASFSASVEY